MGGEGLHSPGFPTRRLTAARFCRTLTLTPYYTYRGIANHRNNSSRTHIARTSHAYRTHNAGSAKSHKVDHKDPPGADSRASQGRHLKKGIA